MRGAEARVSGQSLSPDVGGQELQTGAGRGVRHGRLPRRQKGGLRGRRRGQGRQMQDGLEATVRVCHFKGWAKEWSLGCVNPTS